ncbi:hypothetical protein TIFTF001_030241 [Ficus carica]|uniref:Transcription repressor n=1 Tax=Ficus carica TaxID=3494 RepID=A0AA88DSW0_FICCA|nr:hypothetical protein TIFTF001_030241 [Ficus carica]
MSSNRSKKLLKTIFKANSGCGCGKPKLSDVFEPTPTPKISSYQNPNRPESSSSSSCLGRNDGISTSDGDTIELSSSSTSHSLSSEDINDIAGDHHPQKKNNILKKNPSKKSINDSCIAVVKDSDDPFEDFKQSMKQMIVEKEIYVKKDLQELLRCFLELNSPSHRDIIVRAFTDIWNEIVSQRLLSVSSDDRPSKKTGDKCLDCCAGAKAM